MSNQECIDFLDQHNIFENKKGQDYKAMKGQ